ncbi:MAG: class I SAM-dependent methyltransferase [Caulobacteraceae bacterium]|nr:class I SAM-dependent methyltransferase [Caulobacteraceae bacterium]
MTAEPKSSFGFRDVEATEKVALVRGVFESVADSYDLMNDLMSAGVHRIWKDMAIARLNPQPGETVIDCAGGTGDMARRMVKRVRSIQKRRGGPDLRVNLVDYNGEMIRAGVAKSASLPVGPEPEIRWTVGDAMALPFRDGHADAYVISFGIRNVANVQRALDEARRVLKPGGRFFCLEFSRPVSAALRTTYDAYSFKVIPAIGEIVAKDRDSYQYLVESIRRFPDQKTLQGMLDQAGFARTGYTNYSGGVVALHHGWAI